MMNIKLNYEEKDILVRMIENELEYYENKEDIYEEDIEYINNLKNILKKVGE